MRAGAGKSIIVDNYCSPDTPARVVSVVETEDAFGPDDETEVDPVGYGLNDEEYKRMKEGKKNGVGVPWWISAMEHVPLIGRMVSHFPGESPPPLSFSVRGEGQAYVAIGLYFHSLQQMEPGDFVWRRR